MSGLNYLKLGSTLGNIYNTTQLADATKCHYAFKDFWGEPCLGLGKNASAQCKFKIAMKQPTSLS